MPAPHDWDPRAPEVLEDQVAAYDELRGRCPVAHSEYLGWSVLGHADVSTVLADPDTFSNVVSRRLTVPNGMDPPEHTAYRALNDPYFTPERMAAFEPTCRRIARDLVAGLPRSPERAPIMALARTYALRVQSAFLGWPAELEAPLAAWTAANTEATLHRDRERLGHLAIEFDGHIRTLLHERRALGAAAPADITTELIGQDVLGRPVTDAELVSLLRNWTVGELGTIAASVGIIVDLVSRRPEVQDLLRSDPDRIEEANEELLRIHGPLPTNRRRTTRDVELGGRTIPAGDIVTVVWPSANRDEAVFEDPDEFRLDRDPALNLLWGAGIHGCPGAPLARLELRVVLEELLAATTRIEPVDDAPPARAAYPGSGFTRLPVLLT